MSLSTSTASGVAAVTAAVTECAAGSAATAAGAVRFPTAFDTAASGCETSYSIAAVCQPFNSNFNDDISASSSRFRLNSLLCISSIIYSHR